MHLEPRPGIAWPSPRLRELTDAVRILLGLDDDTAVVIRQFSRGERGCPPLETVVEVLPMDGGVRRWTLHRPPTRSPSTTYGPPCSALRPS
jgi:hypothetical protein